MTPAKTTISGLYAVTPDSDDTQALVRMLGYALEGGARVVQYRNKIAGPALRIAQAAALRRLCLEFAVPLIVNDDLDLALAIEADGVHLGATDGPLSGARTRLEAGKLLGASCYNDVSAARAAQAQGADYCAFGSFFPSAIKPGAVHAPASLLQEARSALSVPIVAIGGVTLVNAPALIAEGADALAVISALFGAPDIRQAAREFSALFPARPA